MKHLDKFKVQQTTWKLKPAVLKISGHKTEKIIWSNNVDEICFGGNEFIELNVKIREQAGGISTSLQMCMRILRPVEIELCELEMEVVVAKAPLFVDRYLKLRTLGRTVFLGVHNPLYVQSENPAVEIRSEEGLPAWRLDWRSGRLRLRMVLDAAALHPRGRFIKDRMESIAMPIRVMGQEFHYSLRVSKIIQKKKLPVVFLSRFPKGSEAGFVVTDHPDFDQISKVKKYLHGENGRKGWLGRGLKMTKGVFSEISETNDQSAASTLKDPNYLNLIKALASDGSEIVPHGFNERGGMPPEKFQEILANFSKQWKPKTWIDHGRSIPYAYTMGGSINEYRLLENLKGNGIHYLWSYYDMLFDACKSLNLLAPPKQDLGAIFSLIIRHVFCAEILVSFHYLRSAFRWHTEGEWKIKTEALFSALRMRAMRWLKKTDFKNPKNKNLLKNVFFPPKKFNDPCKRRDLLRYGAILYSENGMPMHQSSVQDVFLFTTLEALHVKDIYTEKSLTKLISERGLHIGHTYLANSLPYISGIFRSDGTISDEWGKFLDALETFVQAGKVWSAPVSEIMEWMKKTSDLRISVSNEPLNIIIENRSHESAENLTLLFSPFVDPENLLWNGKPANGWRHWGDWLAVWGDAPALSTTEIRERR